MLTRDLYPSIDNSAKDEQPAQQMSPQQGSVRILGRDCWHVDALRRRMGIVSGILDDAFDGPRNRRMTVTQCLMTGFTAGHVLVGHHQRQQIPEDANERVQAALDRCAATQLQHRRLLTLSTGERRRVMLARALAHEPEILLLDEPTTGLDLAARRHFVDLLDSLCNQKMTVLLVTHHLEEVTPKMQHVLLMETGRIQFAGTRKEALMPARIAPLFGISLAAAKSYLDWLEIAR
ncbi:MAG: ATP-binding cassette domain-containing protein [Planctomycetota bacterium]